MSQEIASRVNRTSTKWVYSTSINSIVIATYNNYALHFLRLCVPFGGGTMLHKFQVNQIPNKSQTMLGLVLNSK